MVSKNAIVYEADAATGKERYHEGVAVLVEEVETDEKAVEEWSVL